MVKGKAKIGIIGCGTISETYLKNLMVKFDNLQVVACADIVEEKAKQTSEKFNIPKFCNVEQLLADSEVDIVVNLTIPAVHHKVNMQALTAGKHVYCEKPLALSLEDANEAVAFAAEKGLILASAPDTFLGAGVQTCRKLIDDGAIGKPVGFTANMTSPGVDLWHPAPDFYYKKGGGPMWDMGPYYLTALISLLGPIKQISCLATVARQERKMFDGHMVEVEVPTHYAGIAEFCSGVVGNVNMSFDVWHSRLPLIEIFGTGGSIEVPDPNMFNGSVIYCDASRVQEAVGGVQGGHHDRLIRLIDRKSVV